MSPEVRRRRRTSPWRRVRKRVGQWSPRTRAAVIVGGVLGVLALVVGWTLWSAASQLSDAEQEATLLRASLVRGDAPGARTALDNFRDATGAARADTSGPVWGVLRRLPAVGDDFAALATTAEVLDDLGDDGLAPVVTAVDAVAADTFRPVDGQVPIAQVRALAGPAEQGRRAFAAAQQRLDRYDPADFVGPLSRRFTDFRDLVDTTADTLDTTARAARLLPRMLGTDRPHRYLVVVQNNAEQRSAGGLPGALVLVRVDAGKVSIERQLDMADLAAGRVVEPTEQERAIFGGLLTDKPVDASFTPDVPRVAEIVRARWERQEGTRLDGVLLVDPVAVSYLMRGTGPVAVPGVPPVDATNVVALVENGVYRAGGDRASQSAVQQQVARSVFDAFLSGTGDAPTAIAGLVQGVGEGRIRLHSFNADEQREIAGTAIAGEFARTGPEPTVGVYLNDAGPSKLSYYLRYDAQVLARTCSGGRQVIAGTVDLHSDTPSDVRSLPATLTGEGEPTQRAKAPGDQVLVIYLAAPAGGDLNRVEIDGQRVNPTIRELDGRRLASVALYFEPQQRHRLSFEVTGGPGQTGDVRAVVTPGALDADPGDVAPAACG